MKTFNFNLGTDKFVGDYYDDIVRIINQYDYVKIVAPTECGKTEFVKRFAYNEKVNIIQPTNAICINKFQDDYSKKYFERYGVKPKFNSIRIVGTQTGIFELDDNTSNVMVVDQAVKHYDEFSNIIFLDECHSVNDGTYRAAYIELLKKLKVRKCKLVSMTGTPNNEDIFLGEPDAMIVLSTSNQCSVDVVSCFYNQVGLNVKRIIETSSYEHYLVYTNRYFKRIAQTIEEYSPILIHNDFKTKGFMKEYYNEVIVNGNIKPYPVVMFTQLMNAGVDIFYDAPTNMICVVEDGDIDTASVLQALGRIRKRGLNDCTIKFTIIVAKPNDSDEEEEQLSSNEVLYLKTAYDEFDFLKLKKENYMEWDGEKYVINLEVMNWVQMMCRNLQRDKNTMLSVFRENGFKVNLLKHFDIDSKLRDKKANHANDAKMFTEHASEISNIVSNPGYYEFFVCTNDEPKYENNTVYCNSPAYIKACAKLFNRISGSSNLSGFDLSKCGELTLNKLEEIHTFVKLFDNENFNSFRTISEGDFKLKYNNIPEKTLNKLWVRISNYQTVMSGYEVEEEEKKEIIPEDLINFIPSVIFDDSRIKVIKMKNGGKRGGKSRGKKNNSKKCFVNHNNMPVEEFETKRDAAQFIGVSQSVLTKNPDLLNYEDGCFCWESVAGFVLV